MPSGEARQIGAKETRWHSICACQDSKSKTLVLTLNNRLKLRKTSQLRRKMLRQSDFWPEWFRRLVASYAHALALSALILGNGTDKVFAEPFKAQFDISYVLPGDDKFKRFHVDIESRCIGSFVVYKVRNMSERWPRRANISFFREGDPVLIIFRDIVLERGQTATFKIFSTSRYPVLDMQIKAPWLQQTVVHRSQHKAPRVKGNPKLTEKSKGIVKHAAYTTD